MNLGIYSIFDYWTRTLPMGSAIVLMISALGKLVTYSMGREITDSINYASSSQVCGSEI